MADGICPAREIAGVFWGGSHEPDEAVPFTEPTEPPIWSLVNVNTGLAAQVYVCKHCRGLYMPGLEAKLAEKK